VVQLSARIVHVRDMTPGQSFIDAEPRRRRLAMVSVKQADGFPRSWHPDSRLHAVFGGSRGPVAAPSSLDLLAIDITDLPDARAGSIGEMATLIGSAITIDEIAEATQSTGREVQLRQPSDVGSDPPRLVAREPGWQLSVYRAHSQNTRRPAPARCCRGR